MGKRLANQTFETAQLTLVVTKSKPNLHAAADASDALAETAGAEEEEASAMPQNVLLEESEVLETTAFGGDGKQQEPLSILDQCTVLAGCINVENENPLHGLTHEETVHRYHMHMA